MHRIDKSKKFTPVKFSIATISDSRSIENDKSGDLLDKKIKKSGHEILSRFIIPDDKKKIDVYLKKQIKNKDIDAIITTGGTGLTGRDSTPEVVKNLIDKEIEGFGELFRLISFKKIGTSSLQSRAIAGVAKTTFIFCLPGSPSACSDAWDNILKFQFDSRCRPCNLVELIPRLSEK